MKKQDKVAVRKASDIEQKYTLENIGKQGTELRSQNLLLSQLNQTLSQFMVATNAEILSMKEQLGKKASMESVYPIGSIYISVNSTSPGELFDFGVWEQIKDTFLLSAGDIYEGGEVGGEAEHILTVEEMPKHIHDIIVVEGETEEHETIANAILKSSLESSVYEYRGAANKSMMETGGGEPHNNMPPYLAVYVWKRTA